LSFAPYLLEAAVSNQTIMVQVTPEPVALLAVVDEKIIECTLTIDSLKWTKENDDEDVKDAPPPLLMWN
jgi:hypothetical protein